MSNVNTVRVSKFLSLILRHKPETIGITLDSEGWANVDALLAGLAERGTGLSLEQLVEIVESNDKRRFALNEAQTRIRAVQGHSIDVNLDYAPLEPSARLYHGTVARFLQSIRESGLRPGSRQYVHLSPDIETAIAVGERRGKPVVLHIDAAAMDADGHRFYQAANGVWLTDHVPVRYIVDGV